MLATGRLLLFAGGVLLVVIAAALVFGSGTLGDTAGELAGTGTTRPGIGIRSLALLNLLLAYALSLMILDRLPVWQRLASRLQGVVMLVLSVLGLIAAIVAIFAALQLLLLMVSLLLASPFGTIAYFALWGNFDTATSRALLAAVMSLQVVGLVAVLLVNPTLLKNVWLVLLAGTVVLMTIVLGFLHALPPSFLVSITDAIGAIVAGILTAVWMLFFIVSGLFTLVRAVRSLAPG
jgi:hypothetical protein